MKRFFCLAVACTLLVSLFCGCSKEETKIEPLTEFDFRLHNNNNYFYMTLEGFFSEEAIIDDTLQSTDEHVVVLKDTSDENGILSTATDAEDNPEYDLKIYDYEYTSVSLSNINYDKYGNDQDMLTICEVSTASPNYYTDRDLHVGNTRAEVKAAYGPATLHEKVEDTYDGWIYIMSRYKLEFIFEGKYLIQITLSCLPDEIYEVVEDSSGGQSFVVDENGNVISGDASGFEIIVDEEGSGDTSSQSASSDNTSSGTASNTASDTGSGITVTIDDNNDNQSIMIED
ncbi:MAG: hypothetical protein ACI4II_05630 [Acutalibacteraceae bacterium]